MLWVLVDPSLIVMTILGRVSLLNQVNFYVM